MTELLVKVNELKEFLVSLKLADEDHQGLEALEVFFEFWIQSVWIEKRESTHVMARISEVPTKRSFRTQCSDIVVGIDVLLDIVSEEDSHIASFTFDHKFPYELVEATNRSSERSQC